MLLPSIYIPNSCGFQCLQILDLSGLQATSFRIGQISGGLPNGAWAVSDWVPILVKSSIHMNAIPSHFSGPIHPPSQTQKIVPNNMPNRCLEYNIPQNRKQQYFQNLMFEYIFLGTYLYQFQYSILQSTYSLKNIYFVVSQSARGLTFRNQKNYSMGAWTWMI